MATIELAKTAEEHLDHLFTLEPAELMAQQLMQRGAEHAVAFIVEHEPGNAFAQKVLFDIREGLVLIHQVAREKHVELLGYGSVG